MRPIVRASFVPWVERFEGRCRFLYLDSICIATTGIGLRVDPIEYALRLPFVRPDGTSATPGEIAAAWHAVKARIDLAPHGGGAFSHVSDLRLTEEAVLSLTYRKLDEHESLVRARYGSPWLDWPADAQLALHGMAWAAGAAFRAPRFDACCHALDFEGAARESGLHTRRDPEHARLFRNAAHVLAHGLDPDVLYYPRDLSAEAAPTEPAIPEVTRSR